MEVGIEQYYRNADKIPRKERIAWVCENARRCCADVSPPIVDEVTALARVKLSLLLCVYKRARTCFHFLEKVDVDVRLEPLKMRWLGRLALSFYCRREKNANVWGQMVDECLMWASNGNPFLLKDDAHGCAWTCLGYFGRQLERSCSTDKVERMPFQSILDGLAAECDGEHRAVLILLRCVLCNRRLVCADVCPLLAKVLDVYWNLEDVVLIAGNIRGKHVSDECGVMVAMPHTGKIMPLMLMSGRACVYGAHTYFRHNNVWDRHVHALLRRNWKAVASLRDNVIVSAHENLETVLLGLQRLVAMGVIKDAHHSMLEDMFSVPVYDLSNCGKPE